MGITVQDGSFVTDRYRGYCALEMRQRGICHAHIKRDFAKIEAQGGISALLGARLLCLTLSLITVFACSLSARVTADPGAENRHMMKNVTCRTFEGEAVRRIEHEDVLKDGAIAIPYGDKRFINPYFSNLIALSLVGQPEGSNIVERWMQWYVHHLNWPDGDALFGTVDDYEVGIDDDETSLKKADSRDSYAATFLSVARTLFESGNASQRQYIEKLKYQLDVIGGVIVQEQQQDGLTWDLPSHHVKYLLDNCEAYRGLADLSFLMTFAFKDRKAGEYYAKRAAMLMTGIERELWDPGLNRYLIAKLDDDAKIAPKLDAWYPDAYAQVSPLIEGVVRPSDQRASMLYQDVTKHFPDWPRRSIDPLQARAAVGYAGALLGDRSRTEDLVANLGSPRSLSQSIRVGNTAEEAWLIRACRVLRSTTSH